MYSADLLSFYEKELILAGHSVYQKNCLLLEHVRHMELESLLKFCEFTLESAPSVGLQLDAGMTV